MTDHELIWCALNKLAAIIESRFNMLGPENKGKEPVNRKRFRPDDIPSSAGSKKLIISTGDTSDIDGFFALDKYAKTGADVVFIMNYPAYIGEKHPSFTYDEQNPGLGYKYTADSLFVNDLIDTNNYFVEFMTPYNEYSASERIKRAMTDIAFQMAKTIWTQAGATGTLYFYIGGVNAINPFARTAIKNEVLVYSKDIPPTQDKLNPDQDSIYGINAESIALNLNTYSDIYMDFNGSMAFWNDAWVRKLDEVSHKIRGAFIMGGVYSDVPPITLSSLKDVINRLSCATMNQLYHPMKTAAFFRYLIDKNIKTFVVANNSVNDLATFADAERTQKTNDGIEKFIKTNGLDQPFLRSMALLYYTSKYNPPRKAFDFYNALVLTQYMADPANVHSTPKQLFFNHTYGITFISQHDNWNDTREAFKSNIDTTPSPSDTEFVKQKKLNFKTEKDILDRLFHLPHLTVNDINFSLDGTSFKLSIKP